MTGKWGTFAHRVYTGGNPSIASDRLGISYSRPEFEPLSEAANVLAILKPLPPRSEQRGRRPRRSHKIKSRAG
jgi:hypothetical protein